MNDILLEKPLNIVEAAAFTGLSKNYLYNLVHMKRIPFYKPENGKIYFKPKELHDFIYRGRVSADYELKEKAEAIINGGEK